MHSVLNRINHLSIFKNVKHIIVITFLLQLLSVWYYSLQRLEETNQS